MLSLVVSCENQCMFFCVVSRFRCFCLMLYVDDLFLKSMILELINVYIYWLVGSKIAIMIVSIIWNFGSCPAMHIASTLEPWYFVRLYLNV